MNDKATKTATPARPSGKLPKAKRRTKRSFKERYLALNWTERIALATVFTVITTIVSIQVTNGFGWEDIATGVGTTVGLSLLTYLFLTQGQLVKTLAVWAGHAIFSAATAGIYGLLNPITYTLSIVVFFGISMIVGAVLTLWAQRSAKGRLWITLLLSLSFYHAAAFVTGFSFPSTPWLMWVVGTIFATGIVTLRVIYPRSKKHLDSDHAASEKTTDAVFKQLNDDPAWSTTPLPAVPAGKSEGTSVRRLLAVNAKQQLIVAQVLTLPQAIDFDHKSQATLNGASIAPILVTALTDMYKTTKRSPATLVVAVDGDIHLNRVRYLPLKITTNTNATLGVVALVSAKHFKDGLAKAMYDLQPSSVSSRKLARIRTRISNKGKRVR